MNRSSLTRDRPFGLLPLILVSVFIGSLSPEAATMVFAERKPWPAEHLKKYADVIIVGEIAKVTHEDKAKPSGYVERYYDLEIAIETVEKGKLAPDQKSINIPAWTWLKWPEDRSKWVSGSFGQYPLYSTKGTRVRLYLDRDESGSLKIIPPNGMEKLTAALVREINAEGFRVLLNLEPQVLRLSVPEDPEVVFGRGGKAEARISATLAGVRTRGFVSAAMLAQKAKLFDDGLYAAVDLAAQQGAGTFQGKAALLRRLTEALSAQPDGLSPNGPHVVLAAAQLGQLKPKIPASLEKDVQGLIDGFKANELRSKPIGFYTWSDSLAAIFQQDRMLQTELEGKAGTESVIRALAADPKSQAAYDGYLELVSRLTNPLVHADLRPQIAAVKDGTLDAPEEEIHFFPPSSSHETDLVIKLYEGRSIPEGFNLMDEMIRRIRSGELDLQPRKESGWYDYQTWSLAPLVTPEKTREARKLVLDKSYKQQLIELFKGILALTRETHIKQLEIPEPGEAPPPSRPIVDIAPKLTAEPLATFYARRSWTYHYVRWVLERTFGKDALTKMHRLTPDGPVHENLHDELATMESLFLGAHVTVCRELGLPPSRPYTAHRADQLDQDAAAFTKFSQQVSADPDLGRDARMMVPVFYDIGRRKTKVWVFLGWSSRPVEIGFAKRPAVTVLDANQKPVPEGKGPILNFETAWKSMAYPVMAEVYATKILNRQGFRQHCDKHKTRKQILENLE